MEEADMEMADEAAFEEGTSDQAAAPNQPATQRLIIKNGNLSLQVAHVTEAEQTITQQVADLDGYIVQVTTRGTEEQRFSEITFRVPANSFDQAIAQVEAVAQEVLSRTISGDDVTEEFVDLEARLRTLEATEERLLDLLTQADDVEAAIAVSNSLTDVQGQIEQVQGRMQYLEQSAALSTITVRLQQEPPPPPIVAEDSWNPGAVARGAVITLITIGQSLASLVIVLGIFTPLWLPVVLFVWWVIRRARRQTGQIATEPAE
jgi:uncharacterized membrane-anchored protein